MTVCGRCAESHLVWQSRLNLFRFERGMSRGLESGGLELGPDFVAEAVSGGEPGQGVGAGLVLGGGIRRLGGIGVGASTSGG